MIETKHWAFDLIGIPYADGGLTPAAFNCWGLVRWSFLTHRGIDMPLVLIGGQDQEAAIRDVGTRSGFRPVGAREPQDWDIALMWGPYGRHVGLVLVINGLPQLLHSMEDFGVVLTPMADLWMLGYSRLTYWRHA